MEIFTKTEVQLRRKEIVERIRKGALFIYPTDTIYGIGANAQDEKAVRKIRQVKERSDNPFSVLVPSLEWITNNCRKMNVEGGEEEQWLKKLPGPYTLVLPLKNKNCIAPSVNLGQKTIGVRYPKHWFVEIVKEAGIPIVTTSANKAGKPFMTNLDNLDKDIETEIEFLIYDGEKDAHPSTVVDLTKKIIKER